MDSHPGQCRRPKDVLLKLPADGFPRKAKAQISPRRRPKRWTGTNRAVNAHPGRGLTGPAGLATSLSETSRRRRLLPFDFASLLSFCLPVGSFDVASLGLANAHKRRWGPRRECVAPFSASSAWLHFVHLERSSWSVRVVMRSLSIYLFQLKSRSLCAATLRLVFTLSSQYHCWRY